MTNFRRLVPGLLLGLTIAMAGVGFAQNPKPTAEKKTDACCCKDSCPMMKTGAMKASMSDKAGCCCSDSCSTKDAAMKNHSASTNQGECCCCGDSCAMRDGGSKTATASDKHECCCGGDSCEMKDSAMKNMAMSGAGTGKHDCCCCGGDSCNMKDKKTAKVNEL